MNQKLLYTIRDASVAQWIEQWPPSRVRRFDSYQMHFDALGCPGRLGSRKP